MTTSILNKIDPLWSIVCSSTIVDKDTNGISLINIIERLKITIKASVDIEKKKEKLGWYTTPINLRVASHFYRKEQETDLSFNFQLLVVDPDNKVLGSKAEGSLAFPKKLINLRMIAALNGLPVTKSGTYYIVVRMKDVGETDYIEIRRIPIEIDITIKR